MFKYLLLVCFLSLAAAAFGFMPINAPLEEGIEMGSLRSDGTYHFYYHGDPAWYWPFGDFSYTAVNFDPMDNYGDTTSDAYEVTHVDSLWYENTDGPYYITLYICNDNGGVPDFDNPRYVSDPYEPEYYSTWDEHEISPPVQFNGGNICWVVFSFTPEEGYPISDGDGNSGHSWISSDGYSWELMDSTEAVDWNICVYAEPGTPPEDEEDPIITGTFPHDEDFPSGVPPSKDTAGCHWQDGDPQFNLGIDVDASTFVVRDSDGNYMTGDLSIDDSDIYDVIVVFDVAGTWSEGESYAVETVCYDLAGNSGPAFWIFSTGYLVIEEKSFGAIKANFTQ